LKIIIRIAHRKSGFPKQTGKVIVLIVLAIFCNGTMSFQDSPYEVIYPEVSGRFGRMPVALSSASSTHNQTHAADQPLLAVAVVSVMPEDQ